MDNQIVNYYLLGINKDNGVYAADMTSSKFGTTRIVTNGDIVPPEELENAPMYSYPIKSEITKQEDIYNLSIYLENPFEFPIDINLSQQIPDTLIILSSENGTILNNNISWNMTLEPEEHKEINSILQPQGSTVQQVNVSGAELNMYDRVHDYWIDFLSNNISFNTNIAPVASFIYSPYPSRINQEVTFNASYSSDVDGTISSYSWDFGDLTQASGKIVQHMYTDTGTYVVTLQVTDDKGTVNNSSEIITIKMLSPPQLNQEYPGNNSNGNGRPPSDLHSTISDPTGDSMTVYLRWMNHTGKWVTLQIYFVVGNGTCNFIPSDNNWIWGNTTYFWSVNVTDGTSWTNKTYHYTTKGSRYDVNNNNMVNFQDAGLVWTQRTSLVPYDGLYDVNGNGLVNFQDAGLTWTHRD
ncbi:MAG: PKD domain-containing protein [Thermoplasmata archaeon]|nr:PKD domain-containing protein [Thermoplasmata archaeon]